MLEFFKYFPLKWSRSQSSHKRTNVWILDLKLFKEGEHKIEEVWSWKKFRLEKFVIWKEGTEIKIKKIKEEIKNEVSKESNRDKNQPDKLS